MDELKLQSRETPAIRSFRICLDRPEPPKTILGVVRRVAIEQARTQRTSRTGSLPRRFSAFA